MKIAPIKLNQMSAIITIAVFFVTINGCFPNSRTGIGLVSRNTANEWSYKFHYLKGVVSGGFTAKNENSQLIYESSLTKGKIEFQLYDHANNLITTFEGTNVRDTLDGLFKKGEKYRIRAIVTSAKGHFQFKME